MPVRQHALTIVAPVRESAREGLAKRLDDLELPVLEALGTVSTLHFGRFVLIENTPGDTGGALRLAFESNHDGELADHLRDLARALAPFESVIFGAWEGYEKGELAAFVARRSLTASTFYLGHPGLSVAQIHDDREVRLLLESLLDEEVTAGRTRGSTAVDLRARLVARLAGASARGPVDRGFPPQPWSRLFFYLGVVPLVVVLALLVLPFALLIELWERHHEPAARLVAEDDARLERINAKEDAISQNGLTHYVALRPGPIRKVILTLVLWFLERARHNIAYEGTLGGISSIHFARWVLLGDGTVLFFSNYDGSWEAYLGDFVDQAHTYLTAVWTNTKWFPITRALIFGGAAKESSFKQWTRTCQVENQIWYSAYKDLTVLDVHRNALVREGASGDMNEKQAQAWLARL